MMIKSNCKNSIISQDQSWLKYLCRAINIFNIFPAGRKKTDLIPRLRRNESSNRFAQTTVPFKGMCRSRSIPISGVKFQLVLRVLKHDYCNNRSGIISHPQALSTKRSAPPEKATTTTDTNTKRKKSSKLANVKERRKTRSTEAQVTYDKIRLKIESGFTSSKYNSPWGAKTHAGNVYSLLEEELKSIRYSLGGYPSWGYS
jgi:hypothetical protein